ncbi:hypothetical protein DYB37_005293 [Aphanomyces astaci]|uniref:Secreted protein n=1 Tax=Aphanomyces astaci TaxID=112090 RepID=A0A3R7EWB9_APHAT|nr:hypothetical protein DYB37_005293 [Aphanomyces astaci]
MLAPNQTARQIRVVCLRLLILWSSNVLGCSCPFCHSDNFRTNFTVGSAGTLKKPIMRSDSDCTELSSPEASMLHDDDIEVHFASVADRMKLQEEVSAQVGIPRPASLPNHRSTTYEAFLAGGDMGNSTSCLEEMMLLEAIRRSMADCGVQPKHCERHTIAHRSDDLTPSAAPSAAS